jgi:hypothetical protein
VAEDLAEGANNVYEDYIAAKEAKKPYKFMDGRKRGAKKLVYEAISCDEGFDSGLRRLTS